MDKKALLAMARVMHRIASGIEAEWWAGYMRGLRRHIHGEAFGTDEEHRSWLYASGDPVREARSAGYTAGLSGEWSWPEL